MRNWSSKRAQSFLKNSESYDRVRYIKRIHHWFSISGQWERHGWSPSKDAKSICISKVEIFDRRTHLQRDGASPNYLNHIITYLSSKRLHNWFWRRALDSRSPPSADFNPCDFCLWSYVKSRYIPHQKELWICLKELLEFCYAGSQQKLWEWFGIIPSSVYTTCVK